MIFESLWPLFFLAAGPIIIILYLLKPKGTDYLISSNLLWKKLLKNEQSRTFFEKFVHNILMYLQILIIALLVVALMSPFIQINGHSGGRKVLLIDTSASMQHVGASGKSRLEEAVEQACDYVRTAQNTRFSVVTTDAAGAKLLAVDIADADSLVRTLQGIECSDSGGSLTQAQTTLDTLIGAVADQDTSEEENAADVLVYTDAAGASAFGELRSNADKELYVVGDVSCNVTNEYTAFSGREDGLYDVMVSITNYSDEEVSFDVSLYDDENYDKKVIALTPMNLAPSESRICFFEEVDWQGRTITSRIDNIAFSSGSNDSLARDNDSAAVKSRENLMRGLLVGEGNIFIEKAYLAVTGESIVKAKTDAAANPVSDSDESLESLLTPRTPLKEQGYNIVIYDAGQIPQIEAANRLVFGCAGGDVAETLENVVLDLTDCDLTAGLSGFTIGVNTAYCFAPPEGAESFLEYDGKCVGYYRELDDRKEIVVGFDIRESDFPLRAEFPVFLANAMIYLSDTSWLATNVYYAGEEIALQPWAELDRSQFDSRPDRAGLYTIGNEDYQEYYVVRFQTATESDGRIEADLENLPANSSDAVRQQKVKQTVRHLFILLVLV
ncbi:MAG: BatA and WFA domain-containing protein, partial [Lachnospiraceae bacterium]|nr:BatA and WFA domain-containing protein [Lachnospiraceae bacterium]